MEYPVGENEARRLRVLRDSRILALANSPELDQLCQEARARFDVPIALISLLEEDVQHIFARQGLEATSTPRGQAFCNYTILASSTFVVSNASDDARFRDHPMVTGSPNIRFYAGAPLIYLEAIHLGAFCLIDHKPREFSLGQRAELESFADRAVSEFISLAGGIAITLDNNPSDSR
ncbi:GAF domain-containing protein [Fuscibacter oryzae]|uniref:GAF domain-containing protein n=1 Tax=Fuscibacter oryzae TaxID=2803939 RepID=A0A8J7SVC8_9RHOB|nr:GAF domain-containing protein [Fuscibacter oryzae]MBL4928516.1 GAF domain-containing protein [Fuscibacter oryzae]